MTMREGIEALGAATDVAGVAPIVGGLPDAGRGCLRAGANPGRN